MRLQIGEALVGTPVEGDKAKLTFDGGRQLFLTYKPHPVWDDHIWVVRETGGWPIELRDLLSRQEAMSFESYVRAGCFIVMGRELELALVPDGNHIKWPHASTQQCIRSIELL